MLFVYYCCCLLLCVVFIGFVYYLFSLWMRANCIDVIYRLSATLTLLFYCYDVLLFCVTLIYI